MDVDGILDRNGGVLKELGRRDAKVLVRSGTTDVTGGIGLKITEAFRIAAHGTEVAFVSAFRPAEVSKALKRLSFHGTIVRVPPRD